MKNLTVAQRIQKTENTSKLFISSEEDDNTTASGYTNQNNNTLFSVISQKNKTKVLRNSSKSCYDDKMCFIFTILLSCYTVYMFLMQSSLSNWIVLSPTVLNITEQKSKSNSITTAKLISYNHNETKEESMPNQVITNFFQCTHPIKSNQSPCTYMNIKDFFDSSNGLGYEYKHIAYEYKQKTIYRDLRFFHLQCNITTIIPYNISYIHVHKNGGTTIREAFYNILNKTDDCKGTIFESPEIRKYEITRPRLIRTTSKIMERLSNDQKQYLLVGENTTSSKTKTVNHIALSFLREPVHRFLSSVGETIRQNHIFGCTSTLKSLTARGTIQCIIKDIQARGTIIETHYTPSAIELFLSDSGKGVLLSLYDMKYLKYFLNDVLKFDSHLKLRSATLKEYNGYFDLSINDLNSVMIKDICEIYRMDVVLLRHIGIATPYC